MGSDVSRNPEPALSQPIPASATGSGSEQPRAPASLLRRLGFWGTALIVIGVTIGSGIFRVSDSVADTVGSPAEGCCRDAPNGLRGWLGIVIRGESLA